MQKGSMVAQAENQDSLRFPVSGLNVFSFCFSSNNGAKRAMRFQ